MSSHFTGKFGSRSKVPRRRGGSGSLHETFIRRAGEGSGSPRWQQTSVARPLFSTRVCFSRRDTVLSFSVNDSVRVTQLPTQNPY
ncbi:hypothetical protein FTUN_8656 [Frigoriglobus tundricola]|uniref:Uncharacterized protein n=1 Tax=Frigoriglobus tundricola TaxID=2774151 RepID=A0A6M5Z3N8_9BACT|nr:hypothetical protein FTUN_8656 [Frigoriglobus tundricola]